MTIGAEERTWRNPCQYMHFRDTSQLQSRCDSPKLNVVFSIEIIPFSSYWKLGQTTWYEQSIKKSFNELRQVLGSEILDFRGGQRFISLPRLRQLRIQFRTLPNVCSGGKTVQFPKVKLNKNLKYVFSNETSSQAGGYIVCMTCVTSLLFISCF